MKLANLLVLNAVIALVFALGFLIAPASMATTYGVAPTPAVLFLARLFGAEVLGVGLLCWFTRNTLADDLRRGMVLALLIIHAIGSVVLWIAIQDGVLSSMGWFALAIYLLLALGYAYFQFLRPAPA